MDSLVECPPSILSTTGVRIGGAGLPARIGRATHAMLAAFIRDGDYDLVHSCDAEQLEPDAREEASGLTVYGIDFWQREMQQYFQTPVVESSVDAKLNGKFTLSGTLDLTSYVSGNQAIFLDWKTGRLDSHYWHQMMTYAHLLWSFLERPEKFTVHGVVVFLRMKYHRTIVYTTQSIMEWEHDLLRNVLANPDRYSPGHMCRWCDLSVGCPARKEVIRSAMESILSGGEDSWLKKGRDVLANMTPENKGMEIVGKTVAEIIQRTHLLGSMLDEVRSMLREAVERVGPIPLHDDLGTHLVLEGQDRRKLDAVKAARVLRTKIDDRAILSCCNISLGKVVKEVISRVRTSERSAAHRALIEELDQEGALGVNTVNMLREKVVQNDEPGGSTGQVAADS